MKLYGEELEREIAKRRVVAQMRRDSRTSFRDAAKEFGMKPSEYLNWERGQDVCPHEEYRKTLGGVHKPFMLIEICKVCNHTKMIGKIESEEDCEKHKEALEEALINVGWIKSKVE